MVKVLMLLAPDCEGKCKDRENRQVRVQARPADGNTYKGETREQSSI